MSPSLSRLASKAGSTRSVIGVPQLCGNKNVFARDPSSGKSCLQRPAYLALVPVSFRAIEVSISDCMAINNKSTILIAVLDSEDGNFDVASKRQAVSQYRREASAAITVHKGLNSSGWNTGR